MAELRNIALLFLILTLTSNTTGAGILHSAASPSHCLSLADGNERDFLKLGHCSLLNKKQHIYTQGIIQSRNSFAVITFTLADLCLSLYASKEGANGQKVFADHYVRQDNQRWIVSRGNTEGIFQLKVESSKRCLTARFDNQDSYPVELECDLNAMNQYWIWEEVDYPLQILESVGQSGMCLVSNYILVNYNPAEVAKCDRTDIRQMLRITSSNNFQAPGAWQSALTGQYLAKAVGFDPVFTTLTSWQAESQKWYAEYDSGKIQLMLHWSSSWCLVANSGVDINPCNANNPSHLWKINPIQIYLLKVYNGASENDCVYALDDGWTLRLAVCDKTQTEQQFTRVVVDTNFDVNYLKVNGKCVSAYEDGIILQSVCGQQTNQRWKSIYVTDSKGRPVFRLQSEATLKCFTWHPFYSYQTECNGKYQMFVME